MDWRKSTVARIVFLIVSVLARVYTSAVKTSPKDDEILMIVEIYSSGSRAPVNSNLLNESWVEKIGYGRITSNGMRQQYNLGAHIRNTYSELFNRIVDMSMVRVLSSGRSRSLISAISHNHGLFPASSKPLSSEKEIADVVKSLSHHPPMWNTKKNLRTSLRGELLSEPVAVPLETVDQFKDYMFLPRIDKACPVAKAIRDNYREGNLNKQLYTLQPFIEDLHKALHSINPDLVTNFASAQNMTENTNVINHLYDVFTCSLYENGVLPQGVSTTLYSHLQSLASGYFMLKFEQSDILRLYTDRIIRIILEEMDRRIGVEMDREGRDVEDEDKGLGYLGFSGDDDTVGALLQLFGVSSSECLFRKLGQVRRDAPKVSGEGGLPLETELCYPIPPFSSSIVFELYKPSEGELSVRLVYNSLPLLRSATDSPISYSLFKRILSERGLLPDFSALCGNIHYEYMKRGSYSLLIIIIALGICCVRAGYLKMRREVNKRINKYK